MDAALKAYVERNPQSRRLHEERASFMPGGNTRSVLHVPPFPLTIVRGEGARIWDADGHEYLDFLGEYTAGLYGHSHPAIQAAIRQALADGTTLGGPNTYETQLAAAICGRFPSIELIRFCNSGTEANVMALSLARAATGRQKVVVFEGGYHGGVLYFHHGGSPLNFPAPFVVAQYNDLAAAGLVDGDTAAVLVEPMLGSGGVIPGDRAFLQALRDATSEHGALLVFDEVMTSRLAWGGLQEVLAITPDLTTLGKYLGGGLAFGAFGGRRDLMERFDPSRDNAWPHAGTFNNAVLTMAAGAAGLTQVLTPDEIARLNALGDRLRERTAALGVHATGYGSMVGLHGVEHAFYGMLERGYWYARRGFVALSLPLTEEDVDGFAAALAAELA
ncbi:MAG TPA: aminotransferase class III-fold pyridoxal phosphate-dependent enzyme [Gaiellaceae bacterium]